MNSVFQIVRSYKVSVTVPDVPDFVDGYESVPPDGVKSHHISVGDLSDEELELLAQEWKAQLINRAKIKRSEPSAQRLV